MKNAQRLAFATALATVVLVGIGAYVRATGSGLGCPDWPTCHGGAVPPANRHSIIEFTHRFAASLVGLLVIATAVMAWRYFRHIPLIVWTAIVTVPLVGIQGILGAITVYRELPPEIVATHLLTAMVVLTCQWAVAIGMYFEDPDHSTPQRGEVVRRIGAYALATTALLAALVWVGGYVAESGSSAACEGWPLCNGSVLPARQHQEIWHMAHRYLAAAYLAGVAGLVLASWRNRSVVSWALPLAVTTGLLYVAQVFAGALNVWYTFPDWVTVAHTVLASLIWSAVTTMAFLAFYVPARERRVRHAAVAGALA